MVPPQCSSLRLFPTPRPYQLTPQTRPRPLKQTPLYLQPNQWQMLPFLQPHPTQMHLCQPRLLIHRHRSQQQVTKNWTGMSWSFLDYYMYIILISLTRGALYKDNNIGKYSNFKVEIFIIFLYNSLWLKIYLKFKRQISWIICWLSSLFKI